MKEKMEKGRKKERKKEEKNEKRIDGIKKELKE